MGQVSIHLSEWNIHFMRPVFEGKSDGLWKWVSFMYICLTRKIQVCLTWLNFFARTFFFSVFICLPWAVIPLLFSPISYVVFNVINFKLIWALCSAKTGVRTIVFPVNKTISIFQMSCASLPPPQPRHSPPPPLLFFLFFQRMTSLPLDLIKMYTIHNSMKKKITKLYQTQRTLKI